MKRKTLFWHFPMNTKGRMSLKSLISDTKRIEESIINYFTERSFDMQRNISVIRRRKRFWDIMGFGYLTENVFHKKHSLNCGCGFCRQRLITGDWRISKTD